MTTREMLAHFGRHAWDWDLNEFCRRLNIAPDDYGQRKFIDFRRLHELLSVFDADKLDILFGPDPDEAPKEQP